MSQQPATIAGKIAAYTFSMAIGVILLTQCFVIRYESGTEGVLAIESKEPSLTLLIPGLFLMGLGLGVQIPPELLAKWIK